MGQRHSWLPWLVGCLGLLAAGNVFAAEYYVSPTGSDSNPGTLASPFATLQKGASSASAGDTVYIRGGTYTITTPANSGAGITISKSGTSDTNRIKFWAYQGETPVFDFARLSISGSGYTHGIVVTGSWLHFKGIEIANVPMNSSSNCGMHIDNNSNNIFELMNFHHNKGTGVFVSGGTGGHKFINCDSHDNNDAANNGENADGFGVHYQLSGANTTFNGCRAWYNSDDGWDFISQEVPVIVENSWAMGSGKSSSGSVPGNGNGFKAGSSKSGIRHVIRNCVAWGCKAAGFYANHSAGGNDWYNNTAYNNGTQFNLLASTFAGCTGVYKCDDSLRQDGVTLSGSKAHKMRNNIGFPDKNSYMNGVDTGFNTWDLSITPAAGDFASVSDTGFMGPRQADGSLPNLSFMKLVAGSKMIDKGTNVQIPYTGSAPDLGAYEYGASGSAGASGAGGSPGSGGATGSGGAAGTGGARGTGGEAGTGGTTGTAGTTGAGGRSGVGGTSAAGGAPGTGGGIVGGAPGTGGGTGTAGAPGSGGTAATGGRAGTTVTGGVVSAGGSVVPTAGGATTGGATGSGGLPTTGGASTTTVPVGAGGSIAATGGTPSSSASGGATTGPTTIDATGAGCSCRIAGTETKRHAAFALFGLLMVALRLRRRR